MTVSNVTACYYLMKTPEHWCALFVNKGRLLWGTLLSDIKESKTDEPWGFITILSWNTWPKCARKLCFIIKQMERQNKSEKKPRHQACLYDGNVGKTFFAVSVCLWQNVRSNMSCSLGFLELPGNIFLHPKIKIRIHCMHWNSECSAGHSQNN